MWWMQQAGEPAGQTPGKTPRSLPRKSVREISQEKSWEGKCGSTSRLSRFLHDDDDDNSQPNIGGCAETRTSDRSGAPQWEQGRTGEPADAVLRRGSKQ